MRAEVRVDNISTNRSNLLCPSCNEGYLHQGIVEVFNRQEDDENIRYTVVDSGNIHSQTIANAVSNNPSSRRQGLIIHFECEHCQDTDFKLCIAQHKGLTLMDWEYDDGNDPGSKS
jgi:hypothetical protein